jgi:hypothetical protein
MASYLVNVNIRCQYEVDGLFGQPSFWLYAFNAKKVANVPLARIFVTLHVCLYWMCLMTDFDLWWLKENPVLLNLQCRPRCTVRTFNSLHSASLGIPYGSECVFDYSKFKTLPPSEVFVIYIPGPLKGDYIFFIPVFSGYYPRRSMVKTQGIRPTLSVTIAIGSFWPHRPWRWRQNRYPNRWILTRL